MLNLKINGAKPPTTPLFPAPLDGRTEEIASRCQPPPWYDLMTEVTDNQQLGIDNRSGFEHEIND